MKSLSICLLTFLGLFVCGSRSKAQTALPGKQAATPLQQVPNSDGTLKTESGFNGSLDPRGWRMETTRNGAPPFVLIAAAGDEHWSSRLLQVAGAPMVMPAGQQIPPANGAALACVARNGNIIGCGSVTVSDESDLSIAALT